MAGNNNIRSFEIESFKIKLSKLVQSENIPDEVFADVVYTAISTFGIHEDMFRDTFGLSKGAVDRWTQRQNLPLQIVRPKIIKWIEKQLNAR